MKACVILAAGMGSRLNCGTVSGPPKCLVKVGGLSILSYQCSVLRKLGIERICLVLGHAADEVRSRIEGRCDYIVNERYASTNSLYSLWLARKWVRGPFMLLNCDVVADPHIFERVLSVDGNALAYDSSSGRDPEHMKVTVAGGVLRRIAKNLSPEETDGENVGSLRFDERGATALFERAGEIIAAGGERQWAPAAVDRLAATVPIHCVDVAGLPWAEIDYPEDLRFTEDQVWPAILKKSCLARTTSKSKTMAL